MDDNSAVLAVGGSAAPPALIDGFKSRHNIDVTHAWGMTETNPVGTLARVKHGMSHLDDATKLGCKASQGYAVPFVEQRHVGEDGTILPWDGETMGELEVRGPWVASSYFGDEGPDRFTTDGWFKTGDVVTIESRRGKVTLYGRAGCHLCEEARAAVEAVRAERRFRLEEVDISLDPVLHRRYGERIPVLALEGEELFDYVVDEAVLRERLDRVGPT